MAKKIPQVRVLLFNGEGIGMGFNSDSGLAVGTALDFEPPATEPGQEAQASAQIVTTHDSMMEALGVSAEAKGRYGFSSGSLKVDFSRKTSFNSHSTFVVAKMVINNQVTRGRNFRIRPEARALLDANRHKEFETAFGDSFVRGTFTGGEFFAVMRITSIDTAVQTDLAVTLQAEINGGIAGGAFAGKFTQANTEAHSRSEFHVVFYQKGGTGAEEIGTTLSVDDVKRRLQTLPTAVANHPFPYEIEVATYDTVPIPLPTKEQQEAYLLALADAEQRKLQFLQKRNDLEFAMEHAEFFANPPAPDVLLSAAQAYLRATNAVIQHAISLSRGEINPPQLFDPARLVPPLQLPAIALRRKIGGVERSFADWYARRDEPGMLSDDRKLVNHIGESARQSIHDFFAIVDPGGDPLKTERLRGAALAPVVEDMTRFKLFPFFPGNMGVTSIAHLPLMLPRDKIVELSLARNQELLSVRGLEQFTGLRVLDVDTNGIGDLTPLAGLTSLRELRAARNRVDDVSPLKTCASLEKLDLSGNRITDLSPLAGLVELKELRIESYAFTVHPNDEVTHRHFGNPIQVASGLGEIAGIANPFLSRDRLNVRWGVLRDGPGQQFTGIAERIGQSNCFLVRLTRGNETREDQWRVAGVGPSHGVLPRLPPGAAFDGRLPPGAKAITLSDRDSNPLMTVMLAGETDVTHAASTFLKDLLDATCDVLP
jgi:hypothetical protein